MPIEFHYARLLPSSEEGSNGGRRRDQGCGHQRPRMQPLTPALPMNRRLWSADAHLRSPLTRTWASGLLSLGGSWVEIAGVWESWILSPHPMKGEGEDFASMRSLLPGLTHSRAFVSTVMVTGPSLSSDTCMSAPNSPVATGRPSSAASRATNASYFGMATSGRAERR